MNEAPHQNTTSLEPAADEAVDIVEEKPTLEQLERELKFRSEEHTSELQSP